MIELLLADASIAELARQQAARRTIAEARRLAKEANRDRTGSTAPAPLRRRRSWRRARAA